MKRRKLSSIIELWVKRHWIRVYNLFKAFFWGSFLFVAWEIYGPWFGEIFHVHHILGRVTGVLLVIIINIALTEEFWNEKQD